MTKKHEGSLKVNSVPQTYNTFLKHVIYVDTSIQGS